MFENSKNIVIKILFALFFKKMFMFCHSEQFLKTQKFSLEFMNNLLKYEYLFFWTKFEKNYLKKKLNKFLKAQAFFGKEKRKEKRKTETWKRNKIRTEKRKRHRFFRKKINNLKKYSRIWKMVPAFEKSSRVLKKKLQINWKSSWIWKKFTRVLEKNWKKVRGFGKSSWNFKKSSRSWKRFTNLRKVHEFEKSFEFSENSRIWKKSGKSKKEKGKRKKKKEKNIETRVKTEEKTGQNSPTEKEIRVFLFSVIFDALQKIEKEELRHRRWGIPGG